MSKDDAILGLMRAARRQLRENASSDTAVDDKRVSFRISRKGHNGEKVTTNFYVPELFHLCWTMQENSFVDLCLLDALRTKKVSEVYKNEGFRADRQDVRLLSNWPLRYLRVVGKVVSYEQRETQWVVLVDDGSFDGGCLEVIVDRYVWAMMEVEGACFGVRVGWCVCVYGITKRVGNSHGPGVVTMQASRVSVVAKRGGELVHQMEWWQSVLQTRERLLRPWELDLHSQDAMEALRSLERHEEVRGRLSEQSAQDVSDKGRPQEGGPGTGPGVEVIDLDAEEQEMLVLPAGGGAAGVPLADWSAAAFSRPVGVRVGTAEQLELAVLRTLVREGTPATPAVSFERVYGAYGVTVVLNGLVLGVFLESSVGLMHDELVYRRWKETHFRESKQLLLRSVLERLATQSAVELDAHDAHDANTHAGGGGGGGIRAVGLRPLLAALARVRAVFQGAAAGGSVAVPMKTVRAALWPGAGRVAALAVVGELAVQTGSPAGGLGTDGGPAWKFDCAGDCWVR